MDLKSMLNDAAPKRPPPPLTSHSSSERSVPFPPPLQPPEQKSLGGSYFTQSPYQGSPASTSTWSAGPPSAHTQSPVSHHQPQTPRDSFPHPPYHIPHSHSHSPVPNTSQPPTPSAQRHLLAHPPTPLYHEPHPHLAREISHGQNGVALNNTHAFAGPIANATPLAPAVQFHRPSPHSQRPPSQGYEHHRTYSSGSIASSHSRETIPSHLFSPEQLRREGLQRQISMDRERSISVSPKTIPRPSPFRSQTLSRRQSLLASANISQIDGEPGYPSQEITPTVTSETRPKAALSRMSTQNLDGVASSRESNTPPVIQHPQDMVSRPTASRNNSVFALPETTAVKQEDTKSPTPEKSRALKRQASLASRGSISEQPPRKRLKRGEVPLFAQSARPVHRPLRLHRGEPVARKFSHGRAAPTDVRKSAMMPRVPKQETPPRQQIPVDITPATTPANEWKSITNFIPHEDLSRSVCDWIYQEIGTATPPAGGAVFEIEAKIGQIYDVGMARRVRAGVRSEAIFDKDNWGATKFQSTMDVSQHKKLNDFLNALTEQSHRDLNAEPIYVSHPREFDEFFNLSPEGRHSLPPSITQWLNPRHTPRVRKTLDLNTNTLKAAIIKTRIADLEVYNPHTDFDYRISISLEAPWDGESGHLVPIEDSNAPKPTNNTKTAYQSHQQAGVSSKGGNNRDRTKDRMSYRHLAYQIDLTQVAYSDSALPKEHELEVEISVDMIRAELEILRNNAENAKAGKNGDGEQRQSRYEEMVRVFLDNVRVLCRAAGHGE